MTIDPEMLVVPDDDYLVRAPNPRKLVTGSSAYEYRAKVVADDPDSGSQVTILSYDHGFRTRAEADKKATKLMEHVRQKRSKGLGAYRREDWAKKPRGKDHSAAGALALVGGVFAVGVLGYYAILRVKS